MSRALDKDLLRHLGAEDSRKVYQDISTLFARVPLDELLEIEFLGRSHPLERGISYLQDGNAVAIPKLRIAQAFFIARQVLHEHLQDGLDSGTSKVTSEVTSQVTSATSVLILMDPEHLTAANLRKRAIVSALAMKNKPRIDVLRQEKQFVDSLLTSRLHRHTKSPVLWSHRRWLVKQFAMHNVHINPRDDISRVIMVAALRHPRNYTAWHHARFLLNQGPHLVDDIASDVKNFCLRNHSDISGWSFLDHVVTECIEDVETRKRFCAALLAEVLGIAGSLRWTNESVWVFLRTMVAANAVEVDSFTTVNNKLCSVIPKDSPQRSMLDQARIWCERYCQRQAVVQNLDAQHTHTLHWP
ncbi:hypothetical protein F4778DRAFT_462632 [Xylariomycetidae sp. FL2044]|nr:hypothetical protein F4778DRAFT_462632 [Xylariomycetidae sp. FL2044]